MDTMVYIWIGLFLIFLVIEAVTMDLVTIWFAAGALITFIAALFGAPFWLQLTLFVVTTTLLLILVFPLVKRKLKTGKYPTNVDSLAGKKAVVKETIEFNKIGVASINGVLWSATGEGTFEAGETVLIKEVEGNKLIVTKVE